MVASLGPDFFARPAGRVARDLVGCPLLVDGVGGPIVEVEHYEPDDPASHSHGGPTPRCLVMFGPPGRCYVYRSYGIHWLLNLVCEPEGDGAAVLIRALQPEHGLEEMRSRRPGASDRDLCRGPGRLGRALGVDGALNGAALGDRVRVLPRARRPVLVTGPRIGISAAVERPWRVGALGSPYLSRPFPTPARRP